MHAFLHACQEIVDITHKVTKFTTLDYDEFIRFMREYTAYERKEVQRVFREFDEDASGSLDTEELDKLHACVLAWLPPIRSSTCLVDEDGLC